MKVFITLRCFVRLSPQRGEDCLPRRAQRSAQGNSFVSLEFLERFAQSRLVRFAHLAQRQRTSPDIAPRQPSAVFTGTGFGSMNKSLNNGNNFRCNFDADFKSPDSQARTSAQTSEGNKFEATLTTPAAPTAMNGSVSESSPLKIVNDSGKRRRKSLTRSTLPLASLIETILRHSFAKRATVSGKMSTLQRPGML